MSRISKNRLFGLLLVSSVAASASFAESDGNRYLYERSYHSEISAAQTYLQAVLEADKKLDGDPDRLVIIDVRDATEYAHGHPENAYHVPYPRVYRQCNSNPDNADDKVLRPVDGGGCLYGTASAVEQDPEVFYNQIRARFPDTSQRMATLCRTGARSVRAANILSNPVKYICEAKYVVDGHQLAAYDNCVERYADKPYSRISNIWQGFVGQPKVGAVSASGGLYTPGDDQTLVDLDLEDGSTAKGFLAYQLDLNNDGEVTDEDKDGWRNYQGLPYVTDLIQGYMNWRVSGAGYYDLP